MATTNDTAPPAVEQAKLDRPSTGPRMPSLNQLAARINLNPSSVNPANVASRPRLAAALLRTGSQTSLASTNTNTDSVAVNPPSTRSTSPAGLSTSPPRSNTTTPVGDPGEPLTQENLKELNHETESTDKQEKDKEKRKIVAGYKNIPSLDAITARLAKARSLSIDGTARPPEPETMEDPKTPGLRVKRPEHPLEHSWYVPQSAHETSVR